MKSTIEEITIRGIPICRGIAIGKSFFFDYVQDSIPEFSIAPEEVENEISHYRQAIKRSEEEVRCLRKQLTQDGAHEGALILESHLEMIQDPLLTDHIENEIRQSGKNAEFVFFNHISQYQKKFSSIADPFFRERFRDLLAISRRVLGYMRTNVGFSLTNIPHNSVVFANELAASDSAEAKAGAVSAFVTQHGGATSHAAIVAKSKGIPYVANVNYELLKQHKNSIVIVDGRTGDIVINPTTETLKKYQKLQSQLFDHFRKLEKVGDLSAETIDGYQVGLFANIDMLNELDMFQQYGAGGVGLFRSEYILLSKDRVPHEDEQYEIYRTLVERMKGLPVTIRTFDVGGDKLNLGRAMPQESNPFLGCRAIRFLLKERKIFKTQLRAILRASLFGEVGILLPMVSNLSEILEVKKLIKEAHDELVSGGLHGLPMPRIGSMIEVPSAAITADLIASECDFLSIGTNDLVQYSLAVDRDNQSISGLYNPAHPSIIRLIKMIVTEANKKGIPVSVCGEVAADPRFTPLLLGLGVHQLSVSCRHVPVVKNAIRSTYILSAHHLAEKVLTLSTAQEIQQILNEEYQKNVPDDYFYNC
jgi:phosphotransferase system enzyme I (PtsI)